MNAIAFGAELPVAPPATGRRCPPDAVQAGISSETAIEDGDFATALLAGLARAGQAARTWTDDSTNHTVADIESGLSEPDPDGIPAQELHRSASEDVIIPPLPIWITIPDRSLALDPWNSGTATGNASATLAPPAAQSMGAISEPPESASLPRGIERSRFDPEAGTPNWMPVEGLPPAEPGSLGSSPLPNMGPLHHPSTTAVATGPQNVPVQNGAAGPSGGPMPEVMAGMMHPMPTAPTAEVVPAVSAAGQGASEARVSAGETVLAASGVLPVASVQEGADGDGSTQVSVDAETREYGQALQDSAQSTTTAYREPDTGHAHEQAENGRRENAPGERRPPTPPSAGSGIEPSASTAAPLPTVRTVHHDQVQSAPATPVVTVPSSFGETEAPRSPLHSVQVQLGDTPGEAVNVRFVESRGVVTVSVRTQDELLANALNAGVPALASRLQSHGWSSEFHPVESSAPESRSTDAPSASGTASARQHEAGSAPMVRQAQSGPGAGAGDPNRRPGTGWVEQNEELMNTAALRRLGQKGVLL